MLSLFRRVAGDQLRGDSAFWVFFAYRKIARPNWDSNSWGKEWQSIRTIWYISRDDRAIIATHRLRTANDRHMDRQTYISRYRKADIHTNRHTHLRKIIVYIHDGWNCLDIIPSRISWNFIAIYIVRQQYSSSVLVLSTWFNLSHIVMVWCRIIGKISNPTYHAL